jgi:pimeloyl-ACP methyl ester carboxylesterase
MSNVRAGFAKTDDGLDLYWRTLGEGPPLICCNGVGVSTFFWKYIAQHYRDRYRVILWDYRGHGRSSLPDDPETTDLSVERSAADLRTIVDHLGLTEPAILFGHSMGCQVILEYHHRYPESVRALVPMFGTFARPLDTFMDNPNSKSIFRVLRKATAQSSRGMTRLLLPLYASPVAYAFSRVTGLVDRYYAGKTDIDRYTDHLGQMDPRVFLAMVDQIAEHDLTDHLPHIHVPTLVFGGEDDLFTPLHRSQRMAELIPDAELTILAEGSHAAIVEHPETINVRVDRFLAERL